MLTTEEEFDSDQGNSEQAEVQSNQETDFDAEVAAENDIIPTDLPVDTNWEDQYDTLPSLQPAADPAVDTDHSARHSQSQSLREYLLWQMIQLF